MLLLFMFGLLLGFAGLALILEGGWRRCNMCSRPGLTKISKRWYCREHELLGRGELLRHLGTIDRKDAREYLRRQAADSSWIPGARKGTGHDDDAA